MAIDKRGRKLPKGIRQKGNRLEGRFMYREQSYSVYGDTVKEVQTKMSELKYKLEHGLFVEKKRLILDEWFHTWMETYKRNQVKTGTFITYEKYYDYAIKEHLGKKYLTEIRGEHIQKLYNDLNKQGYATSSIHLVHVVLKGCFQQAFKNGLVERNPVSLVELPRQKEKEEKQAMTKEQQALFMEYAKGSYLYNLFATMLRTGLRIGEVIGLKYSDIDKKNNMLHVQRTLKYVEHIGFLEDTPKTRTSKRDIPLTAAMLQLLEEQKRFYGFKVEKIDRYLFCNENGEPLHRNRVQGEINRIIKQIKQDGNEFIHVTPHTFRHTFATRAIESGMQPQTLKTILGHSSLAMTMDLYSHVMADTKRNEMEKIENAF